MRQMACVAVATVVLLSCAEPPGLVPSLPAYVHGMLRIGNKSLGPHADTVLASMRQPLVVMVVDADGVPVPGVNVRWEGYDGSVTSEAEVPTDAGGESAVSLTLGARAGLYRATASVPGMSGSPVVFAATAHPGRPASIQLLAGDSADVPAGQPVVHTVRVRDAHGNGVAGVRIQWTATEGGTLSWPLSLTNRRGDAEVTRTTGMGQPVQRTIAQAPDLPDSPSVTFTIFTRAAGARAGTARRGDIFVP